MPAASNEKLNGLIQNCSFRSAQACFRSLCPSSFERMTEPLENPDTEHFGDFQLFGQLPFVTRTLLFAYTEVKVELTERACRKAQFDAARAILKARPAADAGIFIFRGLNGAFRLSLISKIYKGAKAEFSHFRRYTYFVDPTTDGNGTFIRQIGGCAFDSLESIQEAFSVEAINKDFYRELSNWYFWAMKHARFPHDDVDLDKDDLLSDKQRIREHDAKNLIRLLTRILFVWFIKQRGLVPDEFFDPEAIAKDYLEGFDPESKETRYYKAILQNFFFATLNQTKGHREFRRMGSDHRDNMALMRYKDAFKDSGQFINRVEAVTPFLNGGLFECLDFLHPTEKGPQGGKKKIYEDGFSDHKSNPLQIPDFLFFGREHFEDLSDDYGDKKRKKESVTGLIHILKRYNFTIVENSPIEQEVALDPELLGKVFENLLASYNPETKTTARKQTGSFYTPRSIVDYMVDESLKAYLLGHLTESGMSEGDAKVGLDLLFSYEEREMDTCFNEAEVKLLLRAIDRCKILDPACGSGAFPMGTLQKLVHILTKLDRDSEKWEAVQLDEAREKTDPTERRERLAAIAQDFLDNGDDYGRKLYLIENCLYGVDIQSIATQVSKLRFFISLIVDQKICPDRPNFGVRPLPNLETKFVTADTLIAIPKPEQQAELFEQTQVKELEAQLKDVRHKIFSAKTGQTKEKYKNEDAALREQIATALTKTGWHNDTAERLAHWDPYKQNVSADFFDPEWMFGLKGFDVVIGNPPYIQIQKFPMVQKEKWIAQNYQTYKATGDIYCLFYERGAHLLRHGGHLCYITSNKWMRAGYGKSFRSFLCNQVRTESVVDFGGVAVFTSAMVDTSIVIFSKARPTPAFSSTFIASDFSLLNDFGNYISQNAVLFTVPQDGEQSWAMVTPAVHSIKILVEAQGIPLGKWDIQINYGIKTGFNEAFYLTQEQRDAFIAEDPQSEKILVPLLRGRFIQRYTTNWDETWLINSHNGIKGRGLLPLNLKKENPLLCQHLAAHEKNLSKRLDKGDHWSNLRNCAYLEDFRKPKLIYPEITKRLNFYFDREGLYYPNNKAFILTGPDDLLGYLIVFFNSSLFRCCFIDNFPNLGEDRRELRKIFMDKIPVKKPTTGQAALFETLVPLVQLAKRIGEDTPASFLEDLIDACVMECYFREHMAERDLLFHEALAACRT